MNRKEAIERNAAGEEAWSKAVEAWQDVRKPSDPVEPYQAYAKKGTKVVMVTSPELGFYGHYLPSHFKKTSIVRTTGRA
jgi:hypothetical protein